MLENSILLETPVPVGETVRCPVLTKVKWHGEASTQLLQPGSRPLPQPVLGAETTLPLECGGGRHREQLASSGWTSDPFGVEPLAETGPLAVLTWGW